MYIVRKKERERQTIYDEGSSIPASKDIRRGLEQAERERIKERGGCADAAALLLLLLLLLVSGIQSVSTNREFGRVARVFFINIVGCAVLF